MSFGTTALTTTYVSATSLTAAVPASLVATDGSFPVTAKNTTTGTASNAATFVVTAAGNTTPTPTGFNPASGPVGTQITITGTNLSTITSVTINGAAATFGSATATAVTATVAAGNTTGSVVVSDGTTNYTVPGGSFTVTAAPSVTTTATTAIGATSATANGNVTSANNSTITERGFVYSLSPNPRVGASGTTKVTATGTTGAFSASLASLASNSTYYVAAYAINGVGTSYGNDDIFTTLPPPVVATLTTNPVTAIAATSATSGGNITADGGDAVTVRGIVYGTTPNPRLGGTGVTNVVSGSGTGSFTANLSGLTANTTYYVAAYATNTAGTGYGADQSFTTTAPPFEDFEAGSKGNYTTGDITLASGTWTFDNALIGTGTTDRKNGTKSARIQGTTTGGGFIAMNFDKPNGAGLVTVNAGIFSGDNTSSSFKVEISNDGGLTYTDITGTAPTLTTTLTAFTFTANKTGGVRLKISTTSTASSARINIDDIYITNYASPITAPTFTGMAFCVSSAAAAFDVKFTPTGTFNAGNQFQVQLSGPTGSFATPTVVGTLASTSSGAELTIPVSIPAGTANGTGYRLRVVSTDAALTGDNSVAITIVNNPTVTVAPTADQSIQTNTNGTQLTATETPAATSRQWVYSTTSGGTTLTPITGATGLNYTPNFATAGDYYVKVVSTFAACGSVTSNEVKITVAAPVVTLTATTSPATSPTEISGLTTTVGTPSAAKTYVLNGSNLSTTPVTVTAPAGFQ
ncbi:beta strand repeat-containing protein, partial [Hymenobacter persicinus]